MALTDLVPSRPDTFAATVLVDSLPFTEGRFLVRYIPAAPQQAMTNIFNVYRRCVCIMYVCMCVCVYVFGKY